MACFLTALLLAALLLVPSPVQSASADLTILYEALFLLRTRHWNPSLETPAIVRAGVPGLNRALARAGVTQRIKPIPEGADEPATIAPFGQRLDEAIRLAGGRLAARELLYWALRSMFDRVGSSHTFFVTPAVQAVGIGIRLGRGVDQWIVAEVAPEGHAVRAGIRRGDAILRIDDVVASELIGDDVVAMIVGASGTQIRLTLRRGTEELQVSVTRGPVTWPVTGGRMLGDGIAYLRIYFFPGVAPAQIRDSLAQLLQA